VLSTWIVARRWPIAAATTWLVAAAALLFRLPFGTPQWDEPLYSAMPYSVLLGNRPYVDELGVFQNAGLLLLPFYRVYLTIEGSADGIILFNRHLYFVYVLVCSVAAFKLAKRLASTEVACCVAALTVIYSYFNLFSLSYNTCGAFGLFCGIVCTALALMRPRPGRLLFGASVCLLSAMFSYPGLTPVVLIYVVIVIAWLFRKTPREARVNGLLGLGAGLALTLAVAVPLAIHVGKTGFARLLAFSRAMGYGTQGILERLNCFHTMAVYWHWIPIAFSALYVALPLACRLPKQGPWLVAIAVPCSFAFCYWQSLGVHAPTAATICLTALPLLAPVCIALNRAWKHASFVLALIWAPSFVSMVTIAYTSSNRFQAASLGSLGALLAGVVSLSAYLENLAQRTPEQRLGYQFVFLSFFLTLLGIEGHSLFATIYGVDPPPLSAHDTRVKSGPLRGALGPKSEVDFLESVDRDLKSMQQGAHTLTVFDDFPAGYLSTRLKSRTFTHWIIWGFLPAKYAHEISRETFGTPDKLPDIVLTVHVATKARVYWERYMRRHYRPVIRRPQFDYVISRRIEQ
jgi:hypothetical protein